MPTTRKWYCAICHKPVDDAEHWNIIFAGHPIFPTPIDDPRCKNCCDWCGPNSKRRRKQRKR